MTTLVFGNYNFKVEEREGKKFIFDIARKKWVILTPEEWVRQHILHYLIEDKKYPASLIAVERGIELNGTQKRFDLVVFSNSGKPKMIVECKTPEETLNEKVFEQIARYNLSLKVDYLWVTNGSLNFVSQLKGGIQLLETVPEWEILNGSQI